MDPVVTTTQQAQQSLWQYGVLGIAVVAFAGVIWFLFRKYDAYRDTTEKIREVERKAMDGERTAWAVERERLRTDYEARNHEVVKNYAQEIQKEHEACRAREDNMRREYTEMVESIADGSQHANDAMLEMLKKFHDRIVSSTH